MGCSRKKNFSVQVLTTTRETLHLSHTTRQCFDHERRCKECASLMEKVTSCTKTAKSVSSVLGKLLPPQNPAIGPSPDAPQECRASNVTCPVTMRHTAFSVSSASSKCQASSRDWLCSMCLACLQAFADDPPLGAHRHGIWVHFRQELEVRPQRHSCVS